MGNSRRTDDTDTEPTEASPSLGDPRAVSILTAEQWTLQSARTLAAQEMFGRATLFTGVLSATVVALALLAQATHFGRETLSIAALLLSVALLIGVATFARAVVINYEDARCVAAMRRLREAYVEIIPQLGRYFVTEADAAGKERDLGHGSPQRVSNLGNSLTTTSSVVGALNSILVAALSSDVAALLGASLVTSSMLGAAISLVSGFLHVRYAASFRRRHPV